jgi:septum formation protein
MHQVITSLCVLTQKEGRFKEYLDYDIAKVYIKDMTQKEIEKWVDEDNPIDKAGAYAIQSQFCVYIDKIEGNYTTVVGLPLHKLYEVIKEYNK